MLVLCLYLIGTQSKMEEVHTRSVTMDYRGGWKEEKRGRGHQAKRGKTEPKTQYTWYDYICALEYVKLIFTEDHSKKMLSILSIFCI